MGTTQHLEQQGVAKAAARAYRKLYQALEKLGAAALNARKTPLCFVLFGAQGSRGGRLCHSAEFVLIRVLSRHGRSGVGR